MNIQYQEFAGANVVVVGGNQGVGPAIVQAFLAHGAKVSVGLTSGAELANAQNSDAILIPADLSSMDSAKAFLDVCEESSGQLAVLIVVPPPVKTQSVMDIAETQIRQILESELAQPVFCLIEAARRMGQYGKGRIISFVSMSGKAGVHKNVAPYAAAKGGLIMFSRVLAAEIAGTGVTVNAVATSLFDVQIAATPEAAHEIAKGIPVGRVGRSDEAAHAALYLASGKSGYVTGETLNLSGGRFMD
ncbi:MAG: SDR family oxidoreductase [Pseudomonadota bacterium]